MNDVNSFLKSQISELAFQEVENNTPLVSSKLLDSISIVDLVVAIEAHLGIRIASNEITQENFDTIEQIEIFLARKQVNKP